MNRISINNVVYESAYSLSIINNKVVCDGSYTINGKPAESFKAEPEGNTVSKKYDLTDIKSLYNQFFSVVIDVNPKHDKEELIVTAKEATHKKMNINFNRSSLLIDTHSGSFGEVSITLRAKSLEKIVNNGVGDISGAIITQDLTINNEGTGNIKLQGKAEQLKLNNSGVGNINTLELFATHVSFDNSGVGNIKCTSKVIKKGSLSGVGNVKYHSDEQSHISKSGLGNVKYLGARVFDNSPESVVQKPLKVEPDVPKSFKENNTSFDDMVDSVKKNKDISKENTGVLGTLAKKFKKIL